ncbi:hypothetical protein D3C73_1198500 [compost metagenome]
MALLSRSSLARTNASTCALKLSRVRSRKNASVHSSCWKTIWSPKREGPWSLSPAVKVRRSFRSFWLGRVGLASISTQGSRLARRPTFRTISSKGCFESSLPPTPSAWGSTRRMSAWSSTRISPAHLKTTCRRLAAPVEIRKAPAACCSTIRRILKRSLG